MAAIRSRASLDSSRGDELAVMVIVAMMIRQAACGGQSAADGRRHVGDETYDPARIRELLDALRELARRITRLDAEGKLLDETPSLLEELGDVRSELFRYEVRTTFDSPETAQNRRIVDEATGAWT